MGWTYVSNSRQMEADLMRASNVDGRNEAPWPLNLRFVSRQSDSGGSSSSSPSSSLSTLWTSTPTPTSTSTSPCCRVTPAAAVHFISHYHQPPSEHTHNQTNTLFSCSPYKFRQQGSTTRTRTRRTTTQNSAWRASREWCCCSLMSSLVEEVLADCVRLRDRSAVRSAQAWHLNAAHNSSVSGEWCGRHNCPANPENYIP